jgi:uncharacterized protein (TIGR03067 family)
MRRAMLWALAVGLVPVLATALGLGASARGDEAKAAADLKKMQGTWVQAGNGPDARWVIDGDKVTATVNGQEYKCTLKLNPEATPHPSADLVIKEGPGESPGKTSKGIYKFDGEKLVLCVTRPGHDKVPAEFKEAEDEAYLFELKKEAK